MLLYLAPRNLYCTQTCIEWRCVLNTGFWTKGVLNLKKLHFIEAQTLTILYNVIQIIQTMLDRMIRSILQNLGQLLHHWRIIQETLTLFLAYWFSDGYQSYMALGPSVPASVFYYCLKSLTFVYSKCKALQSRNYFSLCVCTAPNSAEKEETLQTTILVEKKTMEIGNRHLIFRGSQAPLHTKISDNSGVLVGK